MTELKVLEFPIDKTRVDRPIEKVLESLIDNMENIQELIVIGKTKDGQEISTSTWPTIAQLVFVIEQYKYGLLFEKT